MRRVLWPLRSRLMGTIGVALVPVVAIVLLLSVKRRNEALESHRDELLRLVRNSTRDPALVVEVVRTDLELLAHVETVRSLDADSTTRLLASVLADREFVANLGLVAPDGRLVASALPFSVPPDSHPPAHELLSRVLAERRFAVGRPHVGAVAKRPVIPVARPVVGADGSVVGALYASIDVAWLQAFASRLELPPDASVLLLDTDGSIFVRHPEPERWAGRSFAGSALLSAARAEREPSPLVAPDLDGVPCTFAVGRLGDYEDAPLLVVGIPVSVAEAEGRRVLLLGLLTAAGFAVLCAATALWDSGPFFAREYRPLLGAVRRFAAGDLSARAGTGGGRGELAEIARAYDAGAAGIERLTLERVESESRLRALARRLQTVRDEEQARIARELHDEFGQALTSLKLGLAEVARGVGDRDPAVTRRVERLSGDVDGTFVLVRRIASELRPPLLDHLGLTEAARWHVQEFARTSQVRCSFASSPEVDAAGPERAFAAFRVLQESLTNVSRHAAAASVRVDLHVEGGTLVLEVEDDGRGFDPALLARTPSLGIVGMRERAEALGGSLEVTRGTKGGTRVRLRLPAREGSRP